ncbi:hypothetical protein Tco_0836727 [Tanacetum coccineum]
MSRGGYHGVGLVSNSLDSNLLCTADVGWQGARGGVVCDIRETGAGVGRVWGLWRVTEIHFTCETVRTIMTVRVLLNHRGDTIMLTREQWACEEIERWGDRGRRLDVGTECGTRRGRRVYIVTITLVSTHYYLIMAAVDVGWTHTIHWWDCSERDRGVCDTGHNWALVGTLGHDEWGSGITEEVVVLWAQRVDREVEGEESRVRRAVVGTREGRGHNSGHCM